MIGKKLLKIFCKDKEDNSANHTAIPFGMISTMIFNNDEKPYYNVIDLKKLCDEHNKKSNRPTGMPAGPARLGNNRVLDISRNATYTMAQEGTTEESHSED